MFLSWNIGLPSHYKSIKQCILWLWLDNAYYAFIHDELIFEGVSGCQMLYGCAVIVRIQFIDTHPVIKQLMGLIFYSSIAFYYFGRISMLDVKWEKKKQNVSLFWRRCQKWKRGKHSVIFTPGYLLMTEWFKQGLITWRDLRLTLTDHSQFVLHFFPVPGCIRGQAAA